MKEALIYAIQALGLTTNAYAEEIIKLKEENEMLRERIEDLQKKIRSELSGKEEP